MRIYSEDTKISNVCEMLNTLFVNTDVRSTTNIDAKVQESVIASARDMEMIKMEPDGNGSFQYRITQKGKNYRDIGV